MQQEPLITVVIPVYNGESYLRDCLENMLGQSYKRLEIIVVDDGSTDGSAAIARRYPVRVEQFPSNRGLSAARNAGIELAQGDYVHFMDVDDAVNADFYKMLAEAATATGLPDMVCSGMVNEAKPHRTVLFDKRQTLTTIEQKLLVTKAGKWSYAVRYLFRRTWLNAHNLRFEEGRYIEDVPFTLSAMFFSDALVVVPGAVYTYIHRENSIMTRKDRAHRRKKHRDMRHAKTFRHHFARKHRFKIPGVPTCGPLALFYVKWFT